nr:hypothetical protein [uncultured Methanolobus sp.]
MALEAISYYEENYYGMRGNTSDEVFDALEQISAETGIDVETLWADGETENISNNEMMEKIIKIIIENEGDEIRGETFYWADSFVIPFEIDNLNTSNG